MRYTQTGMSKLLLYLDQSFVSGMAKGRPPHMRKLYDVLAPLVDDDTVVCPRSVVHDQETDLDDRISDAVHRIIRELAGGVSFRTYEEVLGGQLDRACLRYLGLPGEDEGAWEHAFDVDPRAGLRRPRVDVRIKSPEEWAEGTRAMKDRVLSVRTNQSSVHGTRVTTHRWRGTLDDLVEPQFGGIIQCNFNSQSELAMRLALTIVTLTPEAKRRENPDLLAEFLDSAQLRAIPIFNIWANLEAGFLYHEANRVPRASDVFDQMALSLVLPYVDIATMDQSMKGMAQRLNLDQQYGAEIYSPTEADVRALISRLQSLDR